MRVIFRACIHRRHVLRFARRRPGEAGEVGFPRLYPGLHLLPSNGVFYSRTGWGQAGPGGGPFPGDDVSAYFELTAPDAGVWTKIAGTDPGPADRTKGMSVMLLDSERILMLVVGGSDSNTNDSYELLDATDLSPTSAWTNPIAFPDGQHRSLASAVLLPDGTVFMAGGTGGSGAPCGIFDPATDQWSPAAALPSVRDYHSVALLLPDARVMMAGWDNPKIEIYSPPYLSTGDRPEIIEAPASISHGDRFWIQVQSAESVDRAVLVRPMAVTHQTDSEQRVIEVATFERHGSQLLLGMPDGVDLHAIAPSGYYMLFVLDREGVPSVAHWIPYRLAELAGVAADRRT